ncbi:hypothetical protein AJ88_16500 [Mesorhizobium amorphae CCBAU 01583]|nr:hypothetical protein AJ88_20705 [Mesorhizobium amorphae CCBAU 01583]OWK21339.1 hypothetical protein AJ88_16500 [Mesorhizobium amorphae CCBAU 01583]
MQIVGLPDNALSENRERVQAALYASGLTNVGRLFCAFNPEFPVLWRLAALAPTTALSAVSCDVSFQEMARPNYTAEIRRIAAIPWSQMKVSYGSKACRRTGSSKVDHRS